MKRFHVHVLVEDIAHSVRFYSTLFAARPTVEKPDYAKWMVDDPRVNFAISRRGTSTGVEHLGIQVESEDELAEVHGRLEQAERPVLQEKATTCCYAHSDKQWIADPQGVAWETFLTRGEATVYGRSGAIEHLSRNDTADAPCYTPRAALGIPPPAPQAVAPSCGCGTKVAVE